jgi:CRP-like cAMP-binding protein
MKSDVNIPPIEKREPGRPAMRPIEAAVRAHPFLAGMSPHQYRILSDCAMSRHFLAGEIIFREGDPADRFYLIQKGHVALECHVKERGLTRIQTIGAGEVLGWSWLFQPHLWHFEARALEPTEAIFLYGIPIRDECDADPELGYELTRRIAQVMLERLQATRKRLADFACMSSGNPVQL